MTLEDDLKTLGHHEHFARFIQVLYRLREETISEMHNADYEKLQQLSGRIITYDAFIAIAQR
jgi:hypothetical protein